MNQNIVEQVKDALSPVADKLQQGAEFMYGVYYRQTLVEGVIQVVVSLITLGVLIALTIKLVRNFRRLDEWGKKQHDKEYRILTYGPIDTFMYTAWATIPVLLLWIVWFSAGLPAAIQGSLKVANPHFYTIDRIITSVKAKELR